MSEIENKEGTILIVDDNPTNLRMLLDFLREAGFNTLVANSGQRAISQLKYGLPDLILLDVMMPGIDGFETCRRLKTDQATRNVPVIFMTSLSDTADKVKGFEVGAIDYITKPFQQEEVLARIHTHLTIQHQKNELHRLNKELYGANVTKNKFFSIVAHDLKNSFNHLLGYSEFLVEISREAKEREVEELSTALHESAQNTFRLLKNLLNWSRLQQGTMNFQPEIFDMHDLLEENIYLLKNTAAQKQIKLSHSIPARTRVYADLNMVHVIIRNLISNALKFTYPQGEVYISSQSKEDFLEVAVEDTGMGIPAENLPDLFRIDQKYRREGTAYEKGTGLGLILCKELVEKNGGEIWVESEIDVGSIFRFTLPYIPER